MAEVFYFHIQEDRSIKYKLLEPIMQEDKDVATWRFRIPKVLNDIDMSAWSWWFVYVNAKGQKYSELITLADDIDEPSSYSTADYDIDYGISKFPGSFSFALEAISAEQGGEISGEWHTKTYKHKVDSTLQGNQAEYAETESDVISALMQGVRNKVNQLVGGATPLPVALKSQMTDHDKVYLYTGVETGESTGYWYYYNGTDFVPGGQYGAGVQIDSTLSQSGQAADAKVVGDELNDFYDGEERVRVIWEPGTINRTTGEEADSNTTIRCDYINLVENPITKIKTSEAVQVQWYWYDANHAFISSGSASVNGSYNIALNALAMYVRFAPVTTDKNVVTLVKASKTVTLQEFAEKAAYAHNELANETLMYVTGTESGTFDTSTAVEKINNTMIRTPYISIADSNVYAFFSEVAAGLNLFEYDDSKNFIKRTYFGNNTGITKFAYQSTTAFIRLTWLKAREIKILQKNPFVTQSEKDTIMSGIATLPAIIDILSEKCIHHDNFSRTMSGYEMGKNSEGALTDNSYDTVTGASSDDGVRVDNGLTIAADNSRANVFTVRKINAAHGPNFMVEFNAPASGQGVYIIYNLTDANNFTGINFAYNGTYYSCIHRIIANGSFSKTINNKNIYNSVGYVVKLYFIGGVIAVYIDDKFCYSFYADKVDDYIYIGAYRGATAHFDFVNMFDMISPLIWNSEYLTDSGISALPESTISANADRYALDENITRFSNKSEHFMLYSTDEKINNGRRTERSLVALIQNNLRTMRYEFDVLFPGSVLPDTATGSYGDIFFQLHDRQTGVSRGHVPFDLSLVGNEIHFSQYYSSAQASSTLIAVASGLNLGEVTYDEWMHFEIFIKERYAENQHPFMEIKINGKTVYQSRKPNCANDVKGSSAQYGEYKNTWGTITYSERYIDNFRVTY